MDLYICWANVGRSQVAEWFAKNLWKDVISCASVEARKEKYFNKPEKEITEILYEKFWIDISEQRVYYPEDILEYLDNIENIYFLFDPKKVEKVDLDVLINWKTFWEYLDSIWRKYFIYEVEDPDKKDKNTIIWIVNKINIIIKEIYKK